MDSTAIKALAIVDALSQSEEPRGVAELSRQLGLTKSNTHRILSTLVNEGYVRSHPETGRYSLTLRIWEQGIRVMDRTPVKRIAQLQLKTLFAQHKETVLLSVLAFPDVLYVDKVESEFPVRASPRIGWRAPAWRTASGKALLAYQPEEVLAKTIEDPLITQDNLTELRRELHEVRQRGFALSFNGLRYGVNSVAAPIWGTDKFPVASISASGPSERVSEEQLLEMSSAVLNAATQISNSLGTSSPVFEPG